MPHRPSTQEGDRNSGRLSAEERQRLFDVELAETHPHLVSHISAPTTADMPPPEVDVPGSYHLPGRVYESRSTVPVTGSLIPLEVLAKLTGTVAPGVAPDVNLRKDISGALPPENAPTYTITQ